MMALLAPAELSELVVGVAATAELWRPVVGQATEQRWYAPLFETSSVQVWLISWGSGHELELHDHGPSAGAFAVVAGELVEYVSSEGPPARLRRREIRAGQRRSFPVGYVHGLSNRSSEPALSVHAYSPPLTQMHSYHPATLQPVAELPVGGLERVS
jgi:quercetin dioxygenase-like cupin family protein